MLSRVSVVLVAVLLVLAGCSSDGEPESKKTDPTAAAKPPTVPELEMAWQATDVGNVFRPNDTHLGDPIWSQADRVSLISENAVTTYDAVTGAVSSTVKLPGRPCAASAEVNEAGIGAVVVDGCRAVVAIDTVRGKRLWKRPLDGVLGPTSVSVGKRAVAVSDVRDGTERFDVQSGRSLTKLVGLRSIANGHLVAVTEGDGRSGIVRIHDQDSGKLLTRVKVPVVYDLDALIGEDLAGPLLLSVSSADGIYLRRVEGTRSVAVGRGMRQGVFGPTPQVFDLGDGPVVQYRESATVDRWAPGTRTLDKLTSTSAVLVGVSNGRLIGSETTGSGLAPGAAVLAIDPADPADPLVLGSFAVDGIATLLGLPDTAEVNDEHDLLVGLTRDGFAAFRLPADGTPTSRFAGAKATDDDVTDVEAGDLCVGIKAATLQTLNPRQFADPARGAPANCVFDEQDDVQGKDGQRFHLFVASFAMQATAEASATEVAQGVFTDTSAGTSGNNAVLTAFDPTDGALGDEAAISADAQVLLVRVDNAILRLELTNGPRPAVRRAVLTAVARDLLAELATRRAA